MRYLLEAWNIWNSWTKVYEQCNHFHYKSAQFVLQKTIYSARNRAMLFLQSTKSESDTVLFAIFVGIKCHLQIPTPAPHHQREHHKNRWHEFSNYHQGGLGLGQLAQF